MEKSRKGGFTKEESLRRIGLFLEPVFIFRYCTRIQLMDIGKDVLGFLSVRWMIDYCVKKGYLGVHSDVDFGLKILYLRPGGQALIKQRSQIGVDWPVEKRDKLISRGRFDKRYANIINFRHHNLLVGGYLSLAKQFGVKTYISDWMLKADEFKAKIIPDGIVECDGLKIAVEAEALPRKLDRWKMTLGRYYKYLRKGIITRYRSEEAGVDWNDTFQKLLKNGWAEKIDLITIRLTVDLDAENNRMAEIFGDDFAKILPILQQSVEKDVHGILIIAGNKAIYEHILNRIFFSFPAYREFSMKAVVLTSLDMLKEGKCFYHNMINPERLIRVKDILNNIKKYKVLNRHKIQGKKTTQEFWTYDGILHFIDWDEKRLLEAKDENLSAEDKIKKTDLIKDQIVAKKGMVLGNEIQISEAFRILKEVKYEDEKIG